MKYGYTTPNLYNIASGYLMRDMIRLMTERYDTIMGQYVDALGKPVYVPACPRGGIHMYSNVFELQRANEPVLRNCCNEPGGMTVVHPCDDIGGAPWASRSGAFKVFSVLACAESLSSSSYKVRNYSSYGWKHVIEEFKVDGYSSYVSNDDFKLAYAMYYSNYSMTSKEAAARRYKLAVPNCGDYLMPQVLCLMGELRSAAGMGYSGFFARF